MLDGRLLVDAHVHVPVLGSLAQAWIDWARDFGPEGILEELWDTDGVPRPDRLDALFEEQGVDHALLFCEYSPKATGYQRFEDLLPLVEANPVRFRPVANVNPHLHFPVADEVRRQLDLGAAALKLHPVHGGFRCDDRALYPAYQVLAERGVPLIVHCGTSTFPGSMNELADPAYLLPVVRDFPGVDEEVAVEHRQSPCTNGVSTPMGPVLCDPPGAPSGSSRPGRASVKNRRLSAMCSSSSSSTRRSWLIASTGQTGSQAPQSMHSLGLM